MPKSKKCGRMIAHQKQQILDLWTVKVRSRLLADGEDPSTFLGPIPQVLDAMAHALADHSGRQKAMQLEQEPACQHGLARARNLNYDADHVAQEYAALLVAVTDVLEDSGVSIPRSVYEMILETVDLAAYCAQRAFMQARSTSGNYISPSTGSTVGSFSHLAGLANTPAPSKAAVLN